MLLRTGISISYQRREASRIDIHSRSAEGTKLSMTLSGSNTGTWLGMCSYEGRKGITSKGAIFLCHDER